MHARVNIIFGDRDRVEDGIAHLEDSDRAVVEATDGNQGLTTLADREAGVIVAISYWDEPTHSSDAALTRAREGAAAAAGGDLVVERYEVVTQERRSAAAPGATVRMTRMQIEPARLADAVAYLRAELLPRFTADAGFCGAELLIDRQTGAGLALTSWVTRDDAARTDAVLDGLRDDAAERAGTKFPRTETYSLLGTSAPTG